MIFDSIISVALDAFSLIINLLPDADQDIVNAINNGLTSFKSLMESINWFFPVDTAVYLVSISFSVIFAISLFKLIRYIAGIFTFGVLK